ncbi:xanthine dehydrogenase family protein molybdopterin-binding subunit [Aquincola sp. MAHUQ-54]|uniref:Xanthine dehydrogenase family protein molybdopterin-binding subunit n=1 Tax=Aquincola agrisoli TaxID=3119538 RepID=A0AAW9PXZ6_9BURK
MNDRSRDTFFTLLPPPPQVALGMELPRLDGHAKVTGAARYAAEHPQAGLLYGVVVNTAAARGRIERISTRRALAVPGVVDVLTHENRPRMRSLDLFYKDMTAPVTGSPFKPLHDAQVHCSGQPVALVVARSFEAARYAATLVEVEVAAEPHETDLLAQLHTARQPSALRAGFKSPPKQRGDADRAWHAAPVQVDAAFHLRPEHHNPMEMHATTVLYAARGPAGKGSHLTIHDKTQGSQNVRSVVSRVFGLPESRVTVRNTFVGGAFGSGLRPQYPLLLAVMAALKLKQSVRVVLTRPQMFTFGHRPELWQRVRLGAQRDGRLTALLHDAAGTTSRREDHVEVVVNWSGQLYRCDNVRLDYKLVPLDLHSPMDMRAPGAAQGVHAIEVAMDELAHRLGMDPLALRLKNYAEHDANEDLPFSSKELRACYQQAAQRFGWERRPPRPRAWRHGRELVGWGMATGTWDALQMFARVQAVLQADGQLVLRTAASDIGTGTLTVMTQIAAAAMGLPLSQVRFELGDSTLPVAPVEGGSSHVATVGSAVQGVCERLQRRLWSMARQQPGSPFATGRFHDVGFADGCMHLRFERDVTVRLTDILAAAGHSTLEEKYLLLPAVLKQRKYTRAVHSAVFCEVHVDETLGTVRVTRVVIAVAAGRIINPLTARSQVIGGVVWGIGQALHEETLADHTLGRFMNHDLAQYHVPVNADIGDIEVVFVEEKDTIASRLGAKGVGEIGIVGVAAAVCNAIHHATGRRILSLPMTPDKVMAPDVGQR